MLNSLSYLINAEFPGDVIPLREEAELNILLVDVHPHAKVVKQLAPLLQDEYKFYSHIQIKNNTLG